MINIVEHPRSILEVIVAQINKCQSLICRVEFEETERRKLIVAEVCVPSRRWESHVGVTGEIIVGYVNVFQFQEGTNETEG